MEQIIIMNSDLLSAGWLVSCRGGAWKDFFEEKPYAELRKVEMEGCGWNDVIITELFRKGDTDSEVYDRGDIFDVE
jgi:hypothetical protein